MKVFEYVIFLVTLIGALYFSSGDMLRSSKWWLVANIFSIFMFVLLLEYVLVLQQIIFLHLNCKLIYRKKKEEEYAEENERG